MSEKQADEKAGKRFGTRGILHPKMREKQIKPGEVRNPTGRPKGKSFKTLIEEIGHEDLPVELAKSTKAKTWKELVVRAAFKQALKQAQYFKALLDTEKEANELLTEFLELVNRYGITQEQIQADPVLLEAAIRCGYLADSESTDGTDSTPKNNSATSGAGKTS